MGIRIRSLHDTPRSDGAYRIFVDPVWPRAFPREGASLDEWLADLAPSPWLLDRFGREPSRWGTFRSRYVRQLRSKKRRALLARIADLARTREVVLLYGTPHAERNLAAVIQDTIERDFPDEVRHGSGVRAGW